eukprot:5598503-Pleurochrysis_carterae.AAC.3
MDLTTACDSAPAVMIFFEAWRFVPNLRPKRYLSFIAFGYGAVPIQVWYARDHGTSCTSNHGMAIN